MMNPDGYRMLHEIGVVDFILVELTEYLDTHPEDNGAMEHFNYYARIKNKMCKDFSVMYFPLTKDQAESTKSWRWGESPLPWEGGC